MESKYNQTYNNATLLWVTKEAIAHIHITFIATKAINNINNSVIPSPKNVSDILAAGCCVQGKKLYFLLFCFTTYP